MDFHKGKLAKVEQIGVDGSKAREYLDYVRKLCNCGLYGFMASTIAHIQH